MRRRARRALLWLLYAFGAVTAVAILVPLLGFWLALPTGIAAFGLFLMMPYYSDKK